LILGANAIITGMVAVSFGSYASEAVADGSTPWVKAFAVLVVLVMSLLNILGSRAVANAQTVVVIVVIGILTVFAVTTLANIELDLLSFSGYPSVRDIVSSVALTFFAFLGFGVITFTAKDLANPARDLRVRDETGARTSVLVLAIATTVVVLLAFAFTTLVDEPGTAAALVVILLLSIVLDVLWKRSRDRRLAAA